MAEQSPVTDGSCGGSAGSGSAEGFGGVVRLWGEAGCAVLARAHVAVVGLGGVGSWVAEGLARSGVGELTLVDLDEVCVTNLNRQIQALASTIGRPKVEVMAERIRSIHAAARVHPQVAFFTAATADGFFAGGYDLVVDAIDDTENKCRLLAGCWARGLPVVTTGGAGGRRDPTQVRVADLAQTEGDRLLAEVRRRLRAEHGFPRGAVPFGIDCVYSAEPPVFPRGDGTVGPRAPGERAVGARGLGCEAGWGTVAYVTGVFGFVAAACAVRRLIDGQAAGGITPSGS